MNTSTATRGLVATLGYVALALAGAVGGIGAPFDEQAVPTTHLWSGMGALVLTVPALLVAHQFLGLQARPEQALTGMTTAFLKGGDLALGLTPFLLFFSATTSRGPAMLGILVACIGAAGLWIAGRAVVDAERATQSPLGLLARAQALAMVWASLAMAIVIRVALGVS